MNPRRPAAWRPSKTALERAIADRVAVIDWRRLAADLDTMGCAVIEDLLPAEACRAVAGLYDDESHFRSRIVMARHGFGRGEYKYFAYPLPQDIAALRAAFYPRLAPIANRWHQAMKIAARLPIRSPNSRATSR